VTCCDKGHKRIRIGGRFYAGRRVFAALYFCNHVGFGFSGWIGGACYCVTKWKDHPYIPILPC